MAVWQNLINTNISNVGEASIGVRCNYKAIKTRGPERGNEREVKAFYGLCLILKGNKILILGLVERCKFKFLCYSAMLFFY